jgi:acyl-CoA reductase-like NAD-dependent aldehyde dehydrogenase
MRAIFVFTSTPWEEMVKKYPLVINGLAQTAQDYFEVRNPADSEVIGLAPKATLDDLDQAVAAAEAAFRTWSALPDGERKAYVHAMADKIGAHAEELAQILTMEQGKPLNGLGSRWEIGGAQAWTHYTADLDLSPKTLQDDNAGRVELFRKPIGVVGSITPWNFPVMIAIWHIAPAIRAGNTVVVKPSPYTPLSTIRMVELINEVLPPGVVNCVTGADEIGAAMSTHPGIRKIAFTGSSATGKKIMGSAAATLKRLTLELGGNDAGIVLSDCSPKEVVEGIFWGSFINNGQTCAALKRLYVHDDVYDELCEELVNYGKSIRVGNGMEEGSILGPVQNRPQFEKVKALVEDAKSRGGRVLLGGEAPTDGSLFYPVTFVADVDNGVPLVDEEQFGPALPIIRFHDIDDVIRKANDNPNGLGGSVWSSNIEYAREIAGRLQTGSVWVNKHGAIQPNAPFGGVKQSGLGVSFTEEGLQEYTDIQAVFS